MSKKIAIVTGASSGFGLLCAIELAKNGFEVIATMRDMSKSDHLLEKVNKEKMLDLVHLHCLDVTSAESIDELKEYLNEFPSIDVLVNNAGTAIGGFSEEISMEDFRLQFETNFFGVIAVTQTVLPFMRSQRQGRIINMSSISGKFGFPGLSPYVASKHALEGYSESLRLELKPFGIDVVLIEPGSYKTNIWSGVDGTERILDSPYHAYLSVLLKEIETGKTKHGDPLEVAKLVVDIATQSKAPKLRYPIGKGVKRNLLLKKILPWKILEKVMMKKLFQ
ncbi:SDR family oxidoreductase [Bacillus sp. V3B]|uniref:SDR family oxidoreductase n=1 Tax=Bacillus sp. V3B TaxID=2804915 RepID=UPI0021094829|nr:SDR family oxidoreductase [Bacillus sp. V3B]